MRVILTLIGRTLNPRLFTIGIVLACMCFTGCNAANSAHLSSEDYPGIRLSDFGGNIVMAATTDNEDTSVLSSYSTKFSGSNENRLHNVKKASSAIDETIILPNEVFSYNNAIGPTKKETGFKLARIFVKGKDSKGYGGGVCQVSSTLYNAALEANLLILERHPHSKPVSYVPEGRDAATSYGYIDLKFANNLPNPIKINSFVTDDGVTVRIESAKLL